MVVSTAVGEALDDGLDKAQSALFRMVAWADEQVAEIEFKVELEGGIGGDEMVDSIGGKASKCLCSLGRHRGLDTTMRYSEVMWVGKEKS